jgi:hypothetical protein
MPLSSKSGTKQKSYCHRKTAGHSFYHKQTTAEMLGVAFNMENRDDMTGKFSA